jgi:hypothetical protein
MISLPLVVINFLVCALGLPGIKIIKRNTVAHIILFMPV